MKLFRTISSARFVLLFMAVSLTAQTTPKAAGKPETFTSTEVAADTLIAAAEKFDTAALSRIFGEQGKDIIFTGEPARDKEVATAFAAQARIKKSVTLDPHHKNLAYLMIGANDWPFAVPIAKHGETWSFDLALGRQELLYRRIGGNELDAIEICRGFVEAQHDYALDKHGSSVNQYAQRIISTPGKQDGLAWQNANGSWDGPIGENVARAIESGYAKGSPYHGYYFKVLTGQGSAAQLGEMDYIIKGYMIGGFALLAVPADYGNTGVKTFMVSQDGVVYEKDFGAETREKTKDITRFNPDKTWSPVKP